jgi:hypothetical protein
MTKDKRQLFKIGAAISYVAMIVINGLANGLPLNNRTTGEISEAYPNLFTPAGVTFSIWGFIYLLLAIYIIVQFIPIGKKLVKEDFFTKLNPYFIVTSVLNISWIFAWHYDLIGLSLVIMLALLVSLIKIADVLRVEKFSNIEKIVVRLPYSIYFGWITVATIANVTVFLVSLNWGGFGLSSQLWLVAILLISAGIGIWRMKRDNNIPYGMVFIWAYLGILIKHLHPEGYDGEYAYAISALIFCIYIFIVSQVKLVKEKESFLDRVRENF